ncbi:MAG: ABC transporter permease [Chloroflexi bacterium]|nr:ABC transporter permease [Chloroflexota bacterium]
MSSAEGPALNIDRLLDSRWFLRALAFAAFALVWQVYATAAGGFFVPTFTETAAAIGRQLASPEVWQAFATSNIAMVLGFGLAVVIGIPLGFLMGRFRLAERAINPYLNILLVTPLAGIIPLLMMSLGIGLASRVIVVWSFAIVMVVVNTRAGVRQVDRSLIDMVRLFGAGELGVWRRVILPGSLPAVLAGVRVALGRAVTGMVIVELVMVSVGIGGLILRYQAFFRFAELYGMVVLIILEALILLAIVDWVQRKATPWASMTSIRD